MTRNQILGGLRKVDFTFFPDSDNPNVSERGKEKLPIFGEVILENLIEATHLM